jgi:hypothetical protein
MMYQAPAARVQPSSPLAKIHVCMSYHRNLPRASYSSKGPLKEQPKSNIMDTARLERASLTSPEQLQLSLEPSLPWLGAARGPIRRNVVGRSQGVSILPLNYVSEIVVVV